jgi:hypothetical protein
MGFKARPKEEAPEICVGCSKPLPGVDDVAAGLVVDIRIGHMRKRPRYGRDNFVSENEWGRMHRECFALAIGSSD